MRVGGTSGEAFLEAASRIFLEGPATPVEAPANAVMVGEAAVQRVTQWLAGGAAETVAELRRAMALHGDRPTWRTRTQVIEAVTAVAMSRAVLDDRDVREIR